MKKKIEMIREQLNQLIKTESLNSEKVIELSQKLDKLIYGYYETLTNIKTKQNL